MGKKSNTNVLCTVDMALDYQYANLIDEIEIYQAEIKRADRKAKKKMSKKFNGKGFYPYEYQLEAREHVIHEMSDANFFDRALKCIQELIPVAIIIARLVASLIIAILSVTQIQGRIKPETLTKMKSVYNIAMQVGNRR